MISFNQSPLQLDREGIKERENGERGAGGGGALGDYSREAIISNISIKAKGAINRGTAIIRGNTVVIIEK